MARVHIVKTSRKAHTCTKGHEIPAGEGYQWAAPGYHAPKRIRCLAHPFRPSELTSSMASEPMAAVESFEDALDLIVPEEPDALDELTTALEELVSAVNEYRDARQASLDEWEHGNSTLEELLETAEAAASEAESHQVDDSWTGDDDARDDEEHADHEEALASWVEHVEEQIESARDMAQGLEF